ncbi:MAG: LysM peptidoglycan-binding domain-containing protein, partial [Pedobacter sp.]
MYKYIIVSALAICLNLNTSNAAVRDSIGVENLNGKKLIVHKIVAKDTYYSLGRRYNVLPKDIMTFNDNKYLQIGVIVKVPTTLPFTGSSAVTSTSAPTPATVVDNSETSTSATEGSLIEHSVQKKENLNMLAEKYGTTVNEIKRVNNLRTINLQIGQILKIPAQKVPEEASDIIASASQVKDSNEKIPVVTAPAGINLNEAFIEHTVASNETMYSIATKYKLTMDQLKAKNNLKDNSLSVGQKLLIKGTYPAKPVYVP